MANGFFSGGFAEGAESSRKLGLAELTQQQDVGLRTRGLDIQEKQLQRAGEQDLITRADKQIADTMSVVSEIIKNGLAIGTDPAKLQQTVAPLISGIKPIAQRVGRDPASFDAQVAAQITGPTGVQAATAAGAAEGTKAATSQATASKLLGGGEGGGFIVDPAKRGEAENKLRDDFTKASDKFLILRDFKDRIDNAPKTGAGDIALIFSYMKVLDPASTVREGEFATAANAAGVPSALRQIWNRAVGIGKLDDVARKEFIDASDAIFSKAAERQSAVTNRFAAIAKRQGLNVKNVIDEPSRGISGKTPGGTNFQVLP